MTHILSQLHLVVLDRRIDYAEVYRKCVVKSGGIKTTCVGHADSVCSTPGNLAGTVQ